MKNQDKKPMALCTVRIKGVVSFMENSLSLGSAMVDGCFTLSLIVSQRLLVPQMFHVS
jgi:hypothetical protein